MNDPIEFNEGAEAGSSPVACSPLEVLARELEMTPDQLRSDALELLYMKVGFRPGDRVTIGIRSGFIYTVAKIEKYPHGWMVGIYDEPPGKHVDFWNPASLHLVDSRPIHFAERRRWGRPSETGSRPEF